MKSNGNTVLTEKEKEIMIDKLTKNFKEMFDIMQFEVDNDQQINDSPNRIAKMWVNELLSGCYTEQPKITVFENDSDIDSIVFVGPIDLKSTCSHHGVQFTGSLYCAYVADKSIIGISKFARITDWFMRRFQIQEELTKQIADYIEEKLQPKGVAVYIRAQHGCMINRGVEQSNSWMKTSEMRGCFRDVDSTRAEFFSMVNE